jgi:rubrerythrin
MIPFSFKQPVYTNTNAQQKTEQVFGLTHAPRETERTTTQNAISDAYTKQMGHEVEGKTHEEIEQAVARKHLREFIHDGGSYDEAGDDLKSKANVKNVKQFETEAQIDQYERYFKHLNDATKEKIFDQMSDAEKEKYQKYMKP